MAISEYRMTVAKARRILGMIAKNYTDDQISEIIRLHYQAAELSYRQFIQNKR